MRRLSVSLVVLSLVIVAASPSMAQKPSKLVPVPLNVTVSALVDGVPCGICGDNIDQNAVVQDSTYSHGVEGVEAVFDEWGNLIFNLQVGQARLRFLTYDYAISPTGLVGHGSRHYLSTRGGGKALQVMGVGETLLVETCPSYSDDNGVQYRHAFQRACGVDPSGTSYAIVKRISTTQWTLQSDASTGHVAHVFHLTKGKNPYVFDSTQSLPFTLVLTAR